MPLTLRIGATAQPGAASQSTQPLSLASTDDATLPVERHHAQRCPTCEQVFSGEARFCPFDGDPLVEAPGYSPTTDPLLDQVLDGRYRVVSVLGEGGMGTVYQVRHTTLDRPFALKVLRRDVARDAELTARFMQEAKAAAAIGHPNIVAVSDFGEIAPGKLSPAQLRPVPYFVMEFLNGRSLARLLGEQGTLEAQQVGVIMAQAASGLAAAHAAGVVHRDLKPDNVFLARAGEREYVKLLDFGVAKIAGAGRLTRQGIVFGTPHYMSPEQAAGNAIDHRTDIYALGVIMYECFAGRVPFEADTYMGVLTKHMFATPEPIERVVTDPGCLGALGPIVMRCLEKRPEDRFATMSDVAEALEATLDPTGATKPMVRGQRARLQLRAPEPAGAGRPSARPSAPPSVPGLSRSSPALFVGAAALVVGLGGLAFWATRPAAATAAVLRAPVAEAAAPVVAGAASVALSPPAMEASATPASGRDARPAGEASGQDARPSGETAKPQAHPSTERPPPKRAAAKPARGGGEVVDPW